MKFFIGFICGIVSMAGLMAFAVVLFNKFAEKAVKKDFDDVDDWEDK